MTETHAQLMLAYLSARVGPSGDGPLTIDTPLVSTGLVDSFMMVEVLAELERVTGKRIPSTRITPEDMETVRLMLTVVEQL